MLDITQYLNNLPEAMKYMTAFGGIVVAVKAVTVITPTKVDDRYAGYLGKAYNMIMKLLNILALNIGKDKNKDA